MAATAMFLLFLRYVPAVVFWLAKRGCVVFCRHANLQTLVLTPVVLALLLLPAAFSAEGKKPRSAEEPAPPRAGYTSTGYQPTAGWSLDR